MNHIKIMQNFKQLSRDEVKAALHFGCPARPPLANAHWLNVETRKVLGPIAVKLQREFPDDVIMSGMGVSYWQAPSDDPKYRWAFGNKAKPEGLAIDSQAVIESWDELDQFLSELPDPNRPGITDGIKRTRENHPTRYILVGWGHYLHQRLAYIRGLGNLLYDFCDHIDELRVIMDALIDIYRIWAKRASESGADGIWAGDDLGTQRSLFMSPDMFRKIYAPYYKKLANALHDYDLDFWLHTCGNVTEIMDDLIKAGVDAVHPIQVGTMEDEHISCKYGGEIAFWIGMDVQQLLPFGTPEEVRKECQKRIKTFYRKEGGLILAAGNAIMPETPVENIRAYLETLYYSYQ
ncbi:hypothetical protein GF312_17930 [Candidatus Poribacteria bacterium]|nr:hypothetical protein [Candidatus Poribacteria bacterium]